MLERTLISVAPLVIVAAGAVAAAVLFMALRKEAVAMARRVAALESAVQDAFARMHGEMGELRERLRALEERPCSPSEPARPGLSLNHRAQALRMLRRGADAQTIAASLNLPRPEIELLIRIQRMSATGGSATSGSPDG